ncbi:hypothetical protein Pyn_30788 [Prunus yedoensis var. nudiflora]|uniref:Uncharacterized protein n=1 Tax=Prunus yedoensis var. nudiflora TaxID=2094558 RepID=A0A314UQJ2_PRUYE|nr:hypothetical protein Pyn_30788 [Prunus yedoensis var. nudiflora]
MDHEVGGSPRTLHRSTTKPYRYKSGRLIVATGEAIYILWDYSSSAAWTNSLGLSKTHTSNWLHNRTVRRDFGSSVVKIRRTLAPAESVVGFSKASSLFVAGCSMCH